jgi:hypothetical protein
MHAAEVIDELNSLADYYQNTHPEEEEDHKRVRALDIAIDFIKANEDALNDALGIFD